MKFLRINGWVVPVESASGVVERALIGERQPTETGFAWLPRRRTVTSIGLESIPLSAARATTLEALVAGHGHTWSWDSSLFSSRGLPPISTTGNTIGVGGRFSSCVTVATELAYQIRRGVCPIADDCWTLLIWADVAGDWVHYAVQDSGATWVDGVRDDPSLPAWLTVADGVLTLDPGTYDDALLIAARPDDEVVEALIEYTRAGRAWPQMPSIDVSGDALAPLGGLFVGEVARQDAIAAYVDGAGWTNAARVVPFTLTPRAAEPTALIPVPAVYATMSAADLVAGVPRNLADDLTPLTPAGSLSSVVGQVDEAIRFAGGHYDLGNVFGGVTAFGIAAWARVDTGLTPAARLTVAGKIDIDAGEPGYQASLIVEAGGVTVAVELRIVDGTDAAGLVVRSTTSFPVDEWHHVGFVWNGEINTGGLHLYVDGARVGTTVVRNTDPGAINTPFTTFAIGRANGAGTQDDLFAGDLCEVGFWTVFLPEGAVGEAASRGARRQHLQG